MAASLSATSDRLLPQQFSLDWANVCVRVSSYAHILKSVSVCVFSKLFHLIVIVFELLIFNFNTVILNVSLSPPPISCLALPPPFLKGSMTTLTVALSFPFN